MGSGKKKSKPTKAVKKSEGGSDADDMALLESVIYDAARPPPKVIETEETHTMRFLRLKKFAYLDASGRRRQWESAERTTRSASGVDGAAVIALVRRRGPLPWRLWDGAASVVLISQFRPPLDKTCLELPAGLVDAGESVCEAAVRELKEESGFVGVARREPLQPILSCDPGMSGSNMVLVVVDVDADARENRNPVAEPEEGEFIETRLVPLRGLAATLRRLMQDNDYAVDARLYSWAVGLELAAVEHRQTLAQAVVLGVAALSAVVLALGRRSK